MAGRVYDTAYAAAVAKIGDAVRFAPELRAHLQEIINGPAFKGSHRSQEFLKHIVERALQGDFDDLRERQIGINLFGRSAAYDTAEDAIVRVTASDVRKRLLQHYGQDGRNPRFRIDLPSGSYIPEFRCGSPAIGNAPQTLILTENHATESRGISVLPEVGPPSAVKPRSRRGLAAGLAVGTLVLIALAWSAITHRVLFKSAPADNLISAIFASSPGTVQVIVSDEALVLVQVLSGHRVTLTEYENLSYRNPPELVQQKGLQSFWGSLSTRQITNLGDLQNAARIAENLRARKWNVNIHHARQVNARDLRAGNFIMLGSSFANPWAALFQVEDENFPIVPATPGRPGSILNRHPMAGEPSSFEVESDHKAGTGRTITYATVSVLQNTGRTAHVILVSGLSMSATEMAGAFLLQDESVAKTRSALRLPPGSPLPDFEMVLRVTEFNEIGNSAELVACHKLSNRAR
ncbi:MAG TPA: hypothetical protein VM912_02300 [Terriglobales bacterium]|nr:hypothetical protein [Terriglobales bacterium]